MRSNKPVMLLVLGPHRSGTSLAARMLECLGAVNSANLNPPNEYNPKGYFEDWDTYQFNENVLMPALNSSWHSLSPIDWRSLSAARREELQSQAVEVVRRNYGAGKALSVLKEPRISLLLPFWLEVLERAGFAVKAVCPIRDPLSVARSIAARDRLPLATGCLVYFRAWEAVLQELDAAPHVFFDFADIFSSPTSALEKIARVLQLPMPPDFENRISHFANSHLDAALVHNTSTDKDYEELDATLPPEPAKLHRLLSICSKTQRLSEARSFCQSAARGLKASECYLTALNELGARALAQQISLVSAETERARLSAENSALQTSFASAETERARLSADGAVLRTSLAAAEQTRAQLAAQAAGLQSSLAAAEAERGQLCAENTALLTSLASAEHGLNEARRTAADLRSSTSWQLTKPLRAVTKTFRVFPTLIRRLPDSLRILFQHRKSGLFDARWYLEKNPGLETFAARPFVHFAFFGVHEGRTPNAYVDEEYYLRHAPSARSQGHRALVHYALKGFWRNAPCCRLFDSEFYRAQSEADLKGCPNLLVHYFRQGWEEGLAPHPWFDTRWYLEQNTDIKEAGLEPLRHYLEHGAAEMRNPHPLFYASWYLSQNPDVAAAGIDPLQHYLSHGRQEGRAPHPGSSLDAAGPSDHAKQHRERIAMEAEAIRTSGLFDEGYYRAMYPECSGRCEDPIRDYCENGWREGRNPSDDFSTLGYLEAYQDIKNGGLNPLWHYVLWGASEGRSALPGAAGYEDNVNFGGPLNDIQAIAYFVSPNWPEVRRLSVARKASRTLLEPHGDIGHYEADDADFIRRQSRLARQHGISAWCFPMLDTGKRQANNSLEKFLQSPDIEFSFCLELDLNHEPRPELVGLLQRALADKRYMTLRGKRVLVFSPPSITPAASEGRDTWEQRLAASEWPPLYRIARTTGTKRYLPGEERLRNIDALLDFPLYPVPGETGNFTPLAVGTDRRVIPYSVVVANAEKRMTLNSASPVACYPCVTLGRDEAEKDGGARVVYTNFRLGEYRRWLDAAIAWLRKTRCQDDRFLFLNSWNDWSNGAVLEPDRTWGYCRLNETTRALLGRPLQEASPKVSVIVPNFNHARYLHRRLESIYRQTYKNIEVILLDDASSDQSRDILRIYSELYPEITRTVFNDANSGSVFRQWAKGLGEASGPLVWIAESDDYCDENFLETLVKCFEDEAVMLAYAKTEFVLSEGSPHPFTFEQYVQNLDCRDKWRHSYVNTAHLEVSEALGIINTIPNASSAVFRRPIGMQLLENPEWLDLHVVGDWLFYLHLARGAKIAYSTQTTNFFRRHDGSKAASAYRTVEFHREIALVASAVRQLYNVPQAVTRRFVEQAKNLFEYLCGKNECEFNRIYGDLHEARHTRPRLPNIAISTMGFYPGGAELFPIALANELKRCGHSVLVLSSGRKEDREAKVRRMLRNDVPVVETADIKQTKQTLEDFGIEALNTHQWHLQKYPCTLPDVFGSLKAHIASMHGMIEFGDAFGVTEEQLKTVDRHVDRWIYTADKNLATFSEYGFKPASNPRFVKLPNGITAPRKDAISRSEMNLPEKAFVLCCVSRAIPDKGWAETIEAVDRARKSCGKDIRLVLVGNGEVHDTLTKKGVPDFVTLTGFHENSHGFYAMADMGIMLTKFRSESFPLTILDCLFAGKPFISCDVGEIANMLTDEEGVAGSVLHLDDWTIPVAEAATIIGKFACDSEVYARALSVVPKVAARYEIAEVAGKYLEIFQEAACGNGTSGAGHANGSAEAVPQNLP